MIWTAWKNGKHGAAGVSYGFKVHLSDRPKFNRAWQTVRITLVPPVSGIDVVVNIEKDSFWNGTCMELISTDIREWLYHNGLTAWPKGKPHRFKVDVVGRGHYRVQLASH